MWNSWYLRAAWLVWLHRLRIRVPTAGHVHGFDRAVGTVNVTFQGELLLAPRATGCTLRKIPTGPKLDYLLKRHPDLLTPHALELEIFEQTRQKESSGVRPPRAKSALPKWMPLHSGV